MKLELSGAASAIRKKFFNLNSDTEPAESTYLKEIGNRGLINDSSIEILRNSSVLHRICNVYIIWQCDSSGFKPREIEMRGEKLISKKGKLEAIICKNERNNY